jgi:lipid II:glycine glycyltransferase (peptidoglycan interpeptide bridge formation enzyme)
MADRESWNKFILQNSPRSGAFLQSFEWGELQESLGRKTLKIQNSGLFVKMGLQFKKNYLYSPRGPVNLNFEEISRVAKKENVIFVRFEPAIEKTGEFNLPKNAIKVPHAIPPITLLIDLQKTEEEILKSCVEKTRYNIRLSEKKNLEIKTGGTELFPDFWKLMEETSKRHKIKNFSRGYYEKLLKTKDFAYLAVIYHEAVPLATGLFVDFAGTTTYLFGASSDEQKNLMAPYFMHFEMIKHARKNGQKYYDFWGINPPDKKHEDYTEKYEGITRFKTGFGGETVSYPGTFDLPINKFWYKIYRIGKFIQSILPS